MPRNATLVLVVEVVLCSVVPPMEEEVPDVVVVAMEDRPAAAVEEVVAVEVAAALAVPLTDLSLVLRIPFTNSPLPPAWLVELLLLATFSSMLHDFFFSIGFK